MSQLSNPERNAVGRNARNCLQTSTSLDPMSKQCVQAKDAVGRKLDAICVRKLDAMRPIFRPKTDEISTYMTKYMTKYWTQYCVHLVDEIWTQYCVQIWPNIGGNNASNWTPTDQPQNNMAEMAEFRGREVGTSCPKIPPPWEVKTIPEWSWRLYRSRMTKGKQPLDEIAIKSTQKRWACFKIWHAGSCQNSEGRMRVMTSRTQCVRNWTHFVRDWTHFVQIYICLVDGWGL